MEPPWQLGLLREVVEQGGGVGGKPQRWDCTPSTFEQIFGSKYTYLDNVQKNETILFGWNPC